MYRIAIMLASQSLASRQSALCRPSAAAFRPVRTAPVVRAPVVCRAAAEAEVVEADNGAKYGVAHFRFQRGSAHKVRRILDVLRGRKYEECVKMMELMPYRACEPILKTLKSAAANAKERTEARKSKLVVGEAFADEGPILKRFRCRAQGRGYRIAKPTFHLTIKLEEQE